MLYCHGFPCPLRVDCYRHTQPAPQRDSFAAMPYDAATGTCTYFHTNQPSESAIRDAAYYLWLRAGCPDGYAEEHWAQAYRNLCQAMGRKVA